MLGRALPIARRLIPGPSMAVTLGCAGAAAASKGALMLFRWLWLSLSLCTVSAQTLTNTQSEYITCGGTVSGSTVTYSNQIGNPARDAVYSFCACNDGEHTFDSCGSGFDTWLRVIQTDGAPVADCDNCGIGCGARTCAVQIALNLPIALGSPP